MKVKPLLTHTPRTNPGRFLRVMILCLTSLIYACSVSVPTPTITAPAVTGTPSPTPTFIIPTLIPTATRTPEPTRSPTPDHLQELGDTLYSQSFLTGSGWNLTRDNFGGTSIQDGELILVVSQENTFRFITAPGQDLQDFYIQVDVRISICETQDEFGVIFRITPDNDYYRFALNCEGQALVFRLFEGSGYNIIPRSENTLFLPVLTRPITIGIRAQRDQFYFFINDIEVFNVKDVELKSGEVGLFARTVSGNLVTVHFDDLLIRSLHDLPASATPIDLNDAENQD